MPERELEIKDELISTLWLDLTKFKAIKGHQFIAYNVWTDTNSDCLLITINYIQGTYTLIASGKIRKQMKQIKIR